MIGLAVSPGSSLVDEPVKIQAWGLPPQQTITLRAWLEDEKGQIFSSRAFYRSDMEGKVNLESSPAIGGDFEGVYPMGLFWSLKPSIQFFRLIKRDVMGSPWYIHLELYPYQVISLLPEETPGVSKIIERWYVSPGVQRLQIREGRVRGALFLPPGEGPFLGVVDMFGGIGGLTEFRSSLLASRGFAALALAYFAYEDLPQSLFHVDLTYFEEAAQYLQSHPKEPTHPFKVGDRVVVKVLPRNKSPGDFTYGPETEVVAVTRTAVLTEESPTWIHASRVKKKVPRPDLEREASDSSEVRTGADSPDLPPSEERRTEEDEEPVPYLYPGDYLDSPTGPHSPHNM
ncbi:bile acid-CoA:amino acid N-acyltransferase-like isoform X2 [Pseudophryne corroboree]|uniref:bile acid-CoA:amino acid N-acyltransferase-like isoform X2 n=1 Tax=Pseudophryne corroboree TaxID=495146 RepID=UPI00308219C3